MLLPLAFVLLVGLPGLLLAVWFSWLTRRRWLRGGAILVLKTWLLCLASIAGICTAIVAPVGNTGFGLAYTALAVFCVLTIGGGIPSGVMVLVVSCLTYWLEDGRDKYESNAILIVVLGTFSGLLASIPALRVAFLAMDSFRL